MISHLQRVILLLAQLVSQAGGISHGLLGAVLGVAKLAVHLVQVGLHGLDIGLQLALLAGEGTGLGRQLVDAVVGVSQLVLGSLAGTVGLQWEKWRR